MEKSIEFNVEGQERKDLANAIGEIMGIAPVYAGPGGENRYAFAIMNVILTKEGTMIWDERTENETLTKVFDGLTEQGYEFVRPTLEVQETPVLCEISDQNCYEDLQMSEHEELGLGRERRESFDGENGMQSSDVPENITISVPLEGFTADKIDNLKRLVNSKLPLLKLALGADELPILIDENEGKIDFPWFNFTNNSDDTNAYAQLISRLCATAKEKNRVTAKAHEEFDNPKWSMRVWMLSLGFIGDEFSHARKLFTKPLSGNGSARYSKENSEVNSDEISE